MVDLLSKIFLFENLTAAELGKIEKIVRKERFVRDTVMFLEGDPGNRCYVITKGEVRISKFIPNIGEEALAVLKAGDYFGEMSLIDNFPRSAQAIANTDIEVLAIEKADLDNVLTTDRDLGYKLLWSFTRTLTKRLRETNEKMAGFLALSAGF